jgi:hypothetical protein
MKTKTAYRPKPEIPENIPAENTSAVEAVIAAPEAPAVAIEVKPESEPPAETEAVREYEKQTTTAAAAAAALKRQVDALRQSEALLRQAVQPQRPLTREQLLDQWRRGGVSDANLKFLADNPELIDGWQLTYHAANEATQRGHEPDSDAHREATKEIFHRYLAEAEKQAAQAQTPTEPAMTSTPEFFRPKAPPPARQQHAPVSAPVSRSIPNGGSRSEYQQDPTKVHLSVEEKEIARASGISEIEYARQRLRLEKEKRDGIRQ